MGRRTYVVDIETTYDPDFVEWVCCNPPPPETPSISALEKLGRAGLDEAARELGFEDPSGEFRTVRDVADAVLEKIEQQGTLPTRFQQKREADLDEWRIKVENEARTLPWGCSIVAVGALPLDHDGGHCFAAGPDEVEILVESMDAIEDAERIVTFNGYDFDLPILRTRCVVLGIKLPNVIRSMPHRYSTDKHVDLRNILGGFYRKRTGTLREWCWRFGVDPLPPETDVDEMDLWIGEGDWQKLAEHVEADVRATHTLADRTDRLIPLPKVSQTRYNNRDRKTPVEAPF